MLKSCLIQFKFEKSHERKSRKNIDQKNFKIPKIYWLKNLKYKKFIDELI